MAFLEDWVSCEIESAPDKYLLNRAKFFLLKWIHPRRIRQGVVK